MCKALIPIKEKKEVAWMTMVLLLIHCPHSSACICGLTGSSVWSLNLENFSSAQFLDGHTIFRDQQKVDRSSTTGASRDIPEGLVKGTLLHGQNFQKSTWLFTLLEKEVSRCMIIYRFTVASSLAELWRNRIIKLVSRNQIEVCRYYFLMIRRHKENHVHMIIKGWL